MNTPGSGSQPHGIVHRFERVGRYAWIPVAGLFALVALLYTVPFGETLEVEWLLTVLNLLFHTLLSFLSAILLAGGFLMTGSAAVLLLGMGMLTFSLAGFFASLPLPGGHFASEFTVQVIGTLAMAGQTVVAAVLLQTTSRRKKLSPWRRLLVGYGIVLVGMGLVYWVELLSLMPQFFVEEVGLTRLGQGVLILAIIALAIAAILMLVAAHRRSCGALGWYGLGLCLVAIDLWAGLATDGAGGLVACVGRTAQYLGNVYVLTAAFLVTAGAGNWSVPIAVLQEAYRRSGDLLESSPNAVLIETGGTCAFANPAAARLLGVPSPGALIGTNVIELIHPRYRPLMREYIGVTSANGRSMPLQEIAVVRKDGRPVEVEIVAVATEYEGRPAAQLVMRDISRLRRSEDELRTATSLIEGITKGTEDLIAAEDKEFRYTYFNDAYRREFRKLWGRDPQIGMSMVEAMAPWPEEQRKARELWRRALDGESFQTTTEFGPSEQETHVYDLRFNPVLDGDGNRIGAAHILRDITSSVRTQQALRESEVRYRNLADSMPLLIWTADPDGTVDYYNERWKEYAGIAPDEDGRWSRRMVLHSEDRDAGVAAWTEAVRTGTVYEAEQRVRMRDGSYRWHFTRGVPVRDESGAVRKWYGSSTDIHTLKTVEEELRGNEAHYRRALEDSGLIAARVDADLRYEWIHNPHPDFDAATVIGRRDDELMPADEAAALMALKREVLETGRGIQRELVFSGPEGMRWHAIRGEPLFDSSGNVVGLTTAALDMTNRKRAEQALRESEERFRTLADNISQFAWMADETGRIFWYNRRWFEFTGTTLDEMQGWGWTKVHHPQHVERVVEKIGGCFQSGEAWEDIFPLRGKDGEYRWFLSRAIPLHDGSGKVAGWFGTNTDITELREFEERLDRAREKAEAADRAKSEFLAHMSHEIRTPIGGIIGMIDLLSSRIRDAEQQDHIRLLKEAAGSLLEIINSILDLSQIEAEHVPIEPVEWEARPAVESTLVPFSYAAARKNIDLSLKIADEVPECVWCDKGKIEQIVRNLVSNAVKYTEQGCVVVSVEWDTRQSDRSRLRFRVSDTGIGIPEDRLDAIFDSFVRLRRSVTERNAEGTGLGLTISKRLADLLGATLTVESVLGKGSTFTFTVDAEPRDRPHGRTHDSGDPSLESLPPLRILLVEDNRINQLFLSMVLSEAGHEVAVSGDGRDALDVLQRRSGEGFDVVLMDVQMPVMDGLEATKQIRALPDHGADLPVIALTAFAMAGDEQRFREAGMNGYVTKPVDTEELARVIRHVANVRPA